MLGSKASIIVAFALAMASTAPAFAGMNGTDYLNLMARRSQSSMQEAQTSVRLAPGQIAPKATSKWYPHRYYGSIRSTH